MKTMLGLEGTTKDTDCLKLLEQAVYDLRRGMTVAIEDTSYTLSPAPAATSALWNVLAHRGRYLYLLGEYQKFLRELQGASSFADDTTRFSRNETIRARRDEVQEALKEYQSARWRYSSEDAPAFAEMEERDFDSDSDDFTVLQNLS